MKIIIAPDSFKESCRAIDVCRAIENGCRKADPQAIIDTIPLSEGGEGLIDCFTGETIKCKVSGPLSLPVETSYLISSSNDSKTAIIEMSAAAGLELISPAERNPVTTSTYGVGELILDAYTRGCRKFYIGLGGSGTVDCGCGIAQALGVEFFDRDNHLIESPLCPSLNIQVKYINTSNMKIDISSCQFTAITDVNNPLLGENGAAFVFAEQKGANHQQILQLEQANSSIVSVIENEIGRKLRNIPGGGAAGGLAIAIMAFLDGKIESGINTVLRETNFHQRIKDADLIITGEGAIDPTTANGKVISGVIKAAGKIPVIALCGSIQCELDSLYKLGLTAAYSICLGPISLPDSIKDTCTNLTQTAENVVRTFTAGQKN